METATWTGVFPTRGIELPLVREASFRSAVHLLNIPSEDGGLRKTLRIYSLGSQDAAVDVHISAIEPDHTEKQILDTQVALTGGWKSGDFDSNAPFASVDIATLIDSVQHLIPSGRVNVWVRSVEPTGKIWAFVALVSPDTKQMTAITPGH